MQRTSINLITGTNLTRFFFFVFSKEKALSASTFEYMIYLYIASCFYRNRNCLVRQPLIVLSKRKNYKILFRMKKVQKTTKCVSSLEWRQYTDTHRTRLLERISPNIGLLNTKWNYTKFTVNSILCAKYFILFWLALSSQNQFRMFQVHYHTRTHTASWGMPYPQWLLF